MARGYSSAGSEFSSIRARAYPGIWEKKTMQATAKNIRRDGEAFEDEGYKVRDAVRTVAQILKNELPASVFAYSDVVAGKAAQRPFQIEAIFRVPGGGDDRRRIGIGFNTKEEAEQVSYQLSEGMDLTENGRPLNLRREPDEDEEQKALDERDRGRRAAREEKVADKRRADRNYAAFVQKVKDDMEAERKARTNK